MIRMSKRTMMMTMMTMIMRMMMTMMMTMTMMMMTMMMMTMVMMMLVMVTVMMMMMMTEQEEEKGASLCHLPFASRTAFGISSPGLATSGMRSRAGERSSCGSAAESTPPSPRSTWKTQSWSVHRGIIPSPLPADSASHTAQPIKAP